MTEGLEDFGASTPPVLEDEMADGGNHDSAPAPTEERLKGAGTLYEVMGEMAASHYLKQNRVNRSKSLALFRRMNRPITLRSYRRYK